MVKKNPKIAVILSSLQNARKKSDNCMDEICETCA